MEDIFKDLSSLCDPHPIVSIRCSQPGKKDGQAKKSAARLPKGPTGLGRACSLVAKSAY